MPPQDLTSKRLSLLARLLEQQGVDTSQLPLQSLRRDGEPLPLSFAQEQQWIIHGLDPDSTAYHVHVAVPVDAAATADVITESLRTIGQRHEVLRTVFPALHGRPTAAVLDALDVTLSVVDVGGLPEAEREEAFRRHSREAARAPFDLARGPLLRGTLVRLREARQVLLLTLHHIVTDAWSMGVLLGELRELFEARRQGRPPVLAALPIQYADYAAWQRARLTEATLASLVGYWKAQLAGAPPLSLPTDRRRPPVPSHLGAVVSLAVDRERTESLRRLARQSGATLFSTLTSGFVALLRLCSGERDIVVGVPVSNRDRAEVQGLIGYFVNMVALRIRVSGAWTSADLIARVHAAATDAFAHEQLPFDRLVTELDVERDTSRNPVFQTVFNVLSEQQSQGALHGGTRDGLSEAVQTTRFDLEAHVVESTDGLRISFVYSTDLFDASTARRWLTLYSRLLEQMTVSAGTPLDALSLLDRDERHASLVAWNPPAPAYPRDASLAELFERQAATRPDAVALSSGATTVTYAELNRRANRLARALRTAGVRLDTPVGILLPRGVELIVALLGVLKAGGAYLALNADDPPARQRLLLDQTGASVVVAAGRVAEDVIGGRTAIDVSGATPDDATDLRLDIPADALAYIAFTSGSTGRPKGVAVEQRAVTRLVFGADYITLGPDETLLQLAPVSFDASTLEIWGALLRGGRLVVYEERVVDPQELGATLRETGVTTLWLTSSLYNAVIDQAPDALVGVRQLLTGGEALSVAHVRRGLAQLPTTTLVNGYGPTENTTFTCCFRIPRDLPADAVSVPLGGPIPHTRVYVLDGAGAPVPVGVPGELHVGGDGLARGYVGAPRATAERFVPDGLSGASGARVYRTGDLVRWRPDGTLEFLGRRDGQVKVRGFRIELGEIERAITALPGVAAAAAVVLETAEGKRLAAHAVPAQGATLDGADLRLQLQRTLPPYMVPGAIAVLPALPLNANGKVDRRALPDPFARAATSPGPVAAPRSAVEATLARIWAEVLRLPAVGVHDNFFELGGDSILSIQIVARAVDAGLHCKPKHLFLHPTVAELACAVAEAVPRGAAVRAAGGAIPLTPIQHWFLDRQPEEPNHFNQAVLLRPRADVDPAVVERALQWLVDRHEMLRARFTNADAGWTQQVDGAAPFALARVALSSSTERDISASCDAMQRTLDLANGPVFRAVWMAAADGAVRLLLVAHHLVVDAVSWRIVIHDLERGYACLARGEALPAGDPPGGYREWAMALAAHAERVTDSEIGYWTDVASGIVPPAKTAPLLSASAGRIAAALDAATTAVLLRDVPAAFDASITGVLLGALGRAFASEWRTPALVVDLERHGRSERFDGVDVTRTVGWFTSIHPLSVALSGADSCEALVTRAHDALRAVPDEGLGYGVLRYLGPPAVRQTLAAAGDPEVGFNYLGQFDQLTSDGSAFTLAAEPTGAAESARTVRRHAVDVAAYVVGGSLRTEWTFDPGRHEAAAVERLCAGFVGALQQLAERATVRDGRRSSDPGAAYPLTPMQQGMLFHTLLHPNDGVYSEVFTCRFEGRVDADLFRTAWSLVTQRHDVLRSVFVWEGVPDPIQVVGPATDPAWTLLDWSDEDAETQRVRLQALVAEESRHRFDLAVGPLTRPTLVRLGPRAAQFVWSFHHILLDGWSMAVVLRELLSSYDALLAARPPVLPVPAQYRSYVHWLRRQPLEGAIAYWRETLAGAVLPTPLGIAAPDRMTSAGAVDSRDCVVRVGEQLTAQLQRAARTSRVTVNALLLGAWAFVLSRYSGDDDVVFGITVSGRPATLPGADGIVGLFINTVPTRVRVPSQQAVAGWLRQVQDAQAQQREHEHASLVDVARAAGVPQGVPLFDSILVFENYPVEQAADAGQHALTARYADARHRSNFPLVLTASPGRQLLLQVIYDAVRVDDDAARDLLARLTSVLSQMGADPDRQVGSLSLLTPDEQRELTSLHRRPEATAAAARALTPLLAQAVPAAALAGDAAVVFVFDAHQELAPCGVVGELYVEESSCRLAAGGRARDLAGRLVPDPFATRPGARLIRTGLRGARLRSGALQVHAAAAERRTLASASGVGGRGGEREWLPTEVETRIAAIWCAVLRVDSVSGSDHFFERGGHSLLATRAIARLRDAFGLKLPLALLFEYPVLRDLAAAIEARVTVASTPVASVPASADRAAPAPLSSAQQRLWFLDQLDPGQSAYNVPGALRLDGALDAAALDGAFADIVARHDVLRTTFVTEQGRPVARVQPFDGFAFDRVDCRHLQDGPPRQAALGRLANDEAVAPFDLARGPLLRGRLIRIGEQEHVLLLTLHHIVCDAWSLRVLVSELMRFYEARVTGQPAGVEPLTHQYADFARWQQTWLDAPSTEAQLQYWSRQLADCPTLDLPTDRRRPPAQTFRGGCHTRRLSAEVSTALGRLASEEQATLFMTTLAAFDLLMARYAGQRDIVVGTPVSVRPRPEFEPLIGFFSNTLAMRTRVDRAASFRGLLRDVRTTVLEGFEHQDVPFERIVERVQPSRHLDRHPLFQVLFTMQHAADESFELPRVQLRPFAIERMQVRFDLEVHVSETDGGLLTAFYYSQDLFDESTIAQMAAAFATLLDSIVAAPDVRVDALAIVPTESADRLAGWNRTSRAIPHGPALHHWVEAQVRRTPEAMAVTHHGTGLTYAALNARANQLAHALRRRGVGRDDCIAIAVERGLLLPIAVLGAMKAGGAYMPLDASYPPARLRFMLEDSGAKVLVSQTSLVGGLIDHEAPPVDGSVLCLDRDAHEIAAMPAEDPPGVNAPDDLAYVLYTSGSTGRPKGVAMPHQPLLNLLLWQLDVSGRRAAGRTLQYAPLSFDPSFLELFSTWCAGGTLVLIDEDVRRDFMALARIVEREQVERLYITPAALHQLADAAEILGLPCRSLREVNAAGERLEVTPQIARLLGGVPDGFLFNQYGPTESHVVTVETLPAPADQWPALPGIGVALPNTRIHLLDPSGQPVPIGVPGELYIAGDCLARGYLGNPRLTAERFLPDPFDDRGGRLYRTGDLARYLEGGAIDYLGRIDHQVKLRGYRVELGEIEAVLTQHADVLDAAASIWSSPSGSRHLVAYVVARGPTVAVDDLRRHAASVLPEYMVPAVIDVVDRLPLTPSGKVDRRALPVPSTAIGAAAAHVAPRNAVEVQLSDIWRECLGVERVGIHDDFFAAGGHSLLAAQMVARVRRVWGVELPIRAIFESPTVAGVGERLQTLIWASEGQAAGVGPGAGDREDGQL